MCQRLTLKLELMDWLDWRASTLQGASCFQPHCCPPPWVTDMTAWLHLAFHVGPGVLYQALLCFCSKHFTNWASSSLLNPNSSLTHEVTLYSYRKDKESIDLLLYNIPLILNNTPPLLFRRRLKIVLFFGFYFASMALELPFHSFFFPFWNAIYNLPLYQWYLLQNYTW